ncbi:alkaline shock response membrane anchor protein AmaP [Latilactobacillus graminis]|uniref:Alkaline shock response membrane anchor protein AmaP n=2 Tax=Latilactobacillus graminis TaxID=60519 RepID=A0AA89I1L7_9LACO|nr:alkaline shock response membrane anchor protein AmaP [Latilactobacillus graminis]KRM23410.1 hypothetical protein FC90_GL000366 [Latilactobacillus graminis DSM 20719]QFP80242.1 alkaline shock response membrane anchor protein AmaP [Latilactobacillus graminis]
MNKLTKVVISCASLLGLCQVAWFIALIYPLQQSDQPFMHISWLPGQWVGNLGLGLGLISGLICLYLLLLALFSAPEKRQMIIKTNKGQLALSRKAVEKTIAHSIIEKHRLKDVVVQARFTGRQPKVTANIQALTIDHNEIDQQAQAVKETAQQALQTVFEMPIKAVNVKLSPSIN